MDVLNHKQRSSLSKLYETVSKTVNDAVLNSYEDPEIQRIIQEHRVHSDMSYLVIFGFKPDDEHVKNSEAEYIDRYIKEFVSYDGWQSKEVTIKNSVDVSSGNTWTLKTDIENRGNVGTYMFNCETLLQMRLTLESILGTGISEKWNAMDLEKRDLLIKDTKARYGGKLFRSY